MDTLQRVRTSSALSLRTADWGLQLLDTATRWECLICGNRPVTLDVTSQQSCSQRNAAPGILLK